MSFVRSERSNMNLCDICTGACRTLGAEMVVLRGAPLKGCFWCFWLPRLSPDVIVLCLYWDDSSRLISAICLCHLACLCKAL